jgi:hypothetical protein
MWTLERVSDANGTLPGSFTPGAYSAARLSIAHGVVDAYDLCRRLTGSATVTDTTISFVDIQRTGGECSDPSSSAAGDVIDAVLVGTVAYQIRDTELILYGGGSRLLVYVAVA